MSNISSSWLSDSSLEENRNCFKQVFDLNKEEGKTLDYVFETVRHEICQLTRAIVSHNAKEYSIHEYYNFLGDFR